MSRIYLDHAATTPPLPAVLAGMQAWEAAGSGNPSSLHAEGRAARRAVEDAREEVAGLIGADPDEVIFTAGATEANNLALAGRFPKAGEEFPHLALSTIEHPSVLECAERWQQAGGAVTWLRVDREARLCLEDLDTALTAGADQVAVLAGSNEVGTTQEWGEISRRCRAAGARLHLDVVQVAGKVPFAVSDLGPDTTASLSGHKMGGPKGVGALWVARETHVQSMIVGGGQERGRRAGTENVAAIVGFGIACGEARRHAASWAKARRRGEALLIGELGRLGAGVELLGPRDAHRLPGLLSLRFPGVPGEAFLFALDLKGVAVSLGSACSSGAAQPSHVLSAMGVSKVDNLETVRVSLGREHSDEELREAARIMAETAASCRK